MNRVSVCWPTGVRRSSITELAHSSSCTSSNLLGTRVDRSFSSWNGNPGSPRMDQRVCTRGRERRKEGKRSRTKGRKARNRRGRSTVPAFSDRGHEGARGLLRVGRRQVGYLSTHPRRRSTRMVHTHAEHTDNRPRLAWESFRSAAASSAAAGCCAPTDSLLAGDGATESDGTGQWESNRDAGEPGAGPSDGTNTLPRQRSSLNNFSAAVFAQYTRAWNFVCLNFHFFTISSLHYIREIVAIIFVIIL